MVYGPLKNVLGLSNITLAYTGGVAIGPDIFVFYRSLGLNLKQLYGSTEACVFITMQRNGEVRPDTSGKAAPDVELKIADSGEVMFRGPGTFQGYYKNEEATRETKSEDGWVHTGDAGFLDDDLDASEGAAPAQIMEDVPTLIVCKVVSGLLAAVSRQDLKLPFEEVVQRFSQFEVGLLLLKF